MKKKKLSLILGILAILLVGSIIISRPSVWSRVTYHTREIYGEIKYKLFPPEQSVFTPGQNTPDEVATSVQGTVNAYTPEVSPTTQPTPLPTSTQVPLPASVLLTGVKQEPQSWNNCGPATLSMYLSYWQWGQSQVEAAAFLKPNQRDKNVMPYEMQNFVEEQTDLGIMVRMGGDLYTLKALLAAGFPVMVEKGFEGNDFDGWMGHYNLIIGYDDARQVFFTQDSYLLAQLSKEGKTADNFEVAYADLESNWRAFNNIFLIVYPMNNQNDVINTLGALADENNAFQIAYNRAVQETTTLQDPRELYFAWFNAGTSLYKLQDYAGAAAAYDQAFAIYPSIAEKERPWRMLWYQTGPYFAYYYSARYQDVIDLATTTLDAMSEPILEESYHWRGMAELMLGDQTAAVKDFREALEVHENFAPSLEQLQVLGEEP